MVVTDFMFLSPSPSRRIARDEFSCTAQRRHDYGQSRSHDMKHVVQPFPLKKVSKTHATPPAQLFLLKAIAFKFQKGSQNYWQINKEELFFVTF